MLTEDQDLGLGSLFTDYGGGFQPAEVGHADVQQNYVGLELFRFADGIVTIHRLTADIPILAGRQEGTHAAPDCLVIVADLNSQWRHGSSPVRLEENGIAI